jgi:hypothetical protein
MRALLLVLTAATGCAPMLAESYGETRKEYAGKVSLVFTNATVAKMCGLHITQDRGGFGDNWLTSDGLDSGQSLRVKVKPGIYRATWNTCKPDDKTDPWLAGTLTKDTSFEVKEPTQLFAFVASSIAPTKYAHAEDFHKMIRFPGQQIGGTVAPQPEPAVVATKTDDKPATTPPAKADMSTFVDQKAASKFQATKMKPAASIKRTHDVTTDQVGYAQKRR